MWRYFLDVEEDSSPLPMLGLEKASSEFLGLGGEFWAAIAGALVGGIFSAIISYLLQRQSFREARRQREEDAAAKHRSMAYSLILKMSNLVTNSYRWWETLHEVQALLGPENMEPWQRVLPIANIPEKIYFTDSEMGYLLSLRNDKIFNEVLGLDKYHNSSIEVMTRLGLAKSRLTELLPPPEAFDGRLGEGRIPQDVFFALRPRMIEINELFKDEYKIAEKRYKDAFAALKNLVEFFNERLKLSYKIVSEITEPENAEAIKPAQGH